MLERTNFGQINQAASASGTAHWARLREAWLKEVLGQKRLPCTNTYDSVCAYLDVGELNGKVREWLSQVAPRHQPGELVQCLLLLAGQLSRTLFAPILKSATPSL